MSDGLTFAYSLLSRLAVLSVLPVTLMPRLSKCLAIKKTTIKIVGWKDFQPFWCLRRKNDTIDNRSRQSR